MSVVVKSSRLKFDAAINARIGWHGLSTSDHRDDGDILVTGTDFQDRDIDWQGCKRVDRAIWDRDPAIQLRNGDILVTKDGTIGKVAVVKGLDGPATLNSGVFRVRLTSSIVSPTFMYYVLKSALFEDFVSLQGSGSTIEHLYQRDFVNFSYPLPPLEEQRAIADYLDVETARIDALIAKKQKLIHLLEERVEGSIFFGVTGALTSGDSPTQPSGIEWLGELPAHYGVPTLGAFYRSQLGKMLNAEAAQGPEQRMYIKNTNVRWDEFDLDDLPTMSFSSNDRARCGLVKGDLLVCEGGEVGRSAVWAGEVDDVYFQKALHRVRPVTEGNTRFLMYCLWAASNINAFTVEGNQATIVHLTGEKLREHRFPFPPLDEQAEIVARLDAQREKTSRLTRSLTGQIELLVEHRKALITVAVAGDFTVPGAA